MTPLERQLDRLERGILLRNGITPENPPEQIQALLAAIDKWDEALHPRGRDGRFIEKFGFLSGSFNWKPSSGDSDNPLGGGTSKKVSRAKVVGFSSGNGASADDPWVKVEYEGPDPELQGQVGFARASEVSQAAGTKARLDAPEGQSNDADREAQMEALRARVHEIDQEIAKIDSGEALRERMADRDLEEAGFRGNPLLDEEEDEPLSAEDQALEDWTREQEDAEGLGEAEDQISFEDPEPAPAPDPDLPAGESFEPDPKGDADQVRAFIADSIEKKGLDPEDASIRSRQLDEIYGAIGFGSALDTDRLYKDEDGDWTEERLALHEEMWTELIGQIEAAGIPKERDALALGGLPGAGKSFTLKPGEAASEFGIVSWEPEPGSTPPAGATHVSINPDIIKEILIEKGALPPGVHPDLKPMEQVNFIHEESSELSKLFVKRLADDGYNIVLDNTMEKPDGMIKRMKPLAESGYKFRGLFVDIPVSESRESARKRYERAMASDLGGRFVPSGVQRDEPSKNGRLSPNRDAFDELAGIDADGNPGGPSWFTEFMVVDNTGVAGDPPKPKKEIMLRGSSDGSLARVHNRVDTLASESGEVSDTGEIIPEGDFRNQEEEAR